MEKYRKGVNNMIKTKMANNDGVPIRPPLSKIRKSWQKYKSFYLMLIPGLVYVLIFHYGPMFGLVISFKNYKIFQGVWGSPWVGFDNFIKLFTSSKFYQVLNNTFLISIYKIIFGFPAPIILAILINEVKNRFFARSVQTIVYLPHFISWVVTSGLVINFLSPTDGFVNGLIELFGGEPIFFMGLPEYFRSILVGSDIWKEFGWGAIIYLAALAGISPEINEAAIIDGASKLKRIIYITIPSIIPTIIILLLLRIGGVLNAGFEQVFSMYNPAVYDVGDIIDTYVYRVGIIDRNYGFSSAVGLFKSLIACLLLLGANWLVKKSKQDGIF
jgi:putative aldouronate transport system permease protein